MRLETATTSSSLSAFMDAAGNEVTLGSQTGEVSGLAEMGEGFGEIAHFRRQRATDDI